MNRTICLLLATISLACALSRQASILAKKDVVIRGDEGMFNTYVNVAKDYAVWLTFNTNDPRHNCRNCLKVSESLQLIAEGYRQKIEGNYSSANPPVFFFEIFFTQNSMELFKLMEIQTVPFMLFYSPGNELTAPTRIADHFMYGSAEDLAKYLEQSVNVKVTIPQTLMERYGKFIFGSIAIYGLIAFMRWQRKYVNTPLFYFLLSMVIFFGVIAGTVFNLVRQPPFADVNPSTGQIIFSVPGSQGQYILEGLVMSLMITLASLVLISMIDYIPRNSDSMAKKRGSFYLALFGLVLCLSFISRVFSSKYSGYPYRFFI